MTTINTQEVSKQLVEYFGGGQTDTANALNVSQPTVNGWLSGKHGISAKAALRAERVTKKKFLAVNLSSDLSEESSA